jgi:hypothetical protein
MELVTIAGQETDRDTVDYACEALGDCLGTVFSVGLERPDEQVRDRQAIDFTARDLAGHVLGIEHTLIEPYRGHVLDMKKAEERLGEARRLLDGQLPDDSVFDLAFPAGSVGRMRSDQARAIANWVSEVSPSLSIGGPGYGGHSITSPRGMFLVPLTVYRWRRQFPGPQVRYRLGVDTERNEERARLRIEKALGDKLPKLEASRIAVGAHWTFLCLETEDWQMTNPWVLGELLRGGAGDVPFPDHVALVMRGPGGSLAMVWLIRVAGEWLQVPRFYSRPV